VANVADHGRVSMIHFRCARRHQRHRVRIAVGTRPADAPADRVRRTPWGPLPADRPARLLTPSGDAGLDGGPADAFPRDDRERAPRPGRLPHGGLRHRDGRVRGRLTLRRHRRVRPRPRPRYGDPRARRTDRAPVARRGAPRLPGAAGGRCGRGRGQPALRPRRHHRRRGQPRRPRGALGDSPPPEGRPRRDPVGSGLSLLADRPDPARAPDSAQASGAAVSADSERRVPQA
jgi:hypothetical protein